MPTYREIEEATGASRTLVKTIAKELDPKCEQRRKEGKRWIVSDHLAALIASEASKRLRKPNKSNDTDDRVNAIEIIEEAHRKEMDAVRDGYEARLEAAQTIADGLRESLAERDKTIEGLRADIAALKADNAELRKTLDGISGSKWYTRAFSLHKLLPGRSIKIN